MARTTGVRVTVSTGEGNELVRRGGAGSATDDLDLSTFWVELCGKGVQGDRLETNEVVSRGDGGGDGRRPGGVLVNHLAGTPVAISDGARDKTGLVDLEL